MYNADCSTLKRNLRSVGRNAEVKTMFQKQTRWRQSNLRVNGHAHTHTHIYVYHAFD